MVLQRVFDGYLSARGRDTAYSLVEAKGSDDEIATPNPGGCTCHGPARTRWHISTLLATSTIMFVLGATMLGIALYKSSTNQSCAAQTSVWSPLLEAVEYEDKDLINYFAHETIYRGPPTPEREKAWDKLTNSKVAVIPYDKLGLLNRSADINWERALKSEGEGYIAGIEVFHYLHCLNIVRKFTWLDHYDVKPGGLNGSPVATRMHVDHCLETLRLALMCNADVTPFLIEIVPSLIVGGRADFNSFHRCKKFEPLVDWMEQNGVTHPYNLSGLQHKTKTKQPGDSSS